MRRLIFLIVALIVLLGVANLAQTYLPQIIKSSQTNITTQPVKVVSEESVTIDDVKSIGPSVVTIEELSSLQQDNSQGFDMSPFGIFGFTPPDSSSPQQQQ
ncbi:MAG: hypothetical protein KGJ07_08410, partial [Patescibacteria group bacterium]|nr:hypothetical protein [Patescibacteria group bacterium]